jgi:hypothetical protein
MSAFGGKADIAQMSLDSIRRHRVFHSHAAAIGARRQPRITEMVGS